MALGKVKRTTHTWLKALYDYVDAAGVELDAIGPASIDTVQTPGNTATTISTVAIPASKAITIEAVVNGIKSDLSAGAGYVYRATFKNNAGTVSLIGSESQDYSEEDDATWGGVTFVISGTNVLVKVTGKAATVINWTSNVTVLGGAA